LQRGKPLKKQGGKFLCSCLSSRIFPSEKQGGKFLCSCLGSRIFPSEKQGGMKMALSNLFGWNDNTGASSACGTACGASDK